jgi:hypothetical protein
VIPVEPRLERALVRLVPVRVWFESQALEAVGRIAGSAAGDFQVKQAR